MMKMSLFKTSTSLTLPVLDLSLPVQTILLRTKLPKKKTLLTLPSILLSLMMTTYPPSLVLKAVNLTAHHLVLLAVLVTALELTLLQLSNLLQLLNPTPIPNLTLSLSLIPS